MKCKNCQINKLSKEFPNDMITSKCQHVPNFCLKCVINYLSNSNLKTKQCPECKSPLDQKENANLKLAWDKAPFRIDIDSISALNVPNNQSKKHGGHFYVVMINGLKVRVNLEKTKTVLQLKQAVKAEIHVPVNKQKLIYNGVELKNNLSEYKIVENCHIQLIVLLYSISKGQALKSLTFDLHWGFPGGKVDYLDGTCLLYQDNVYFKRFDWNSKTHPDIPNMSHSGDKVDNANQTAHHCIKANLSDLPSTITRLYFILSSWNSPNIGCFPNPSFNLYDSNRPEDELCNYELRYAATSKAVLMCAVIRNKNKDTWDVFEIGKLSAGNARDYAPLKATIESLSIYL
ncbi:20892_t:CDS:2 [Entrophospora sp. SA101]|nr:7586_t:CDS:2 [Entrophospora candida]CAJ0641720.1 10036_t:CDS:2 [Entrophospora sp. SA101]CAG8570038.1 2506_t:CDS:2 [Entrophospora candida]CAJ0641721.1 10037_t:CDS:2 [Entrophospora sp. SA101]CAJ0767006.1 20892_t:CDS:2 [Entrophospora sp. SA101]